MDESRRDSAPSETRNRERRLGPKLLPWIALGGAVVAALIAAVWWWSSRSAIRTAYLTAPVTRGVIAPTVTASGTVNPVVTVQVGTYVSGVIQELRCDFNTPVKKGQLCAKIDPRPYQMVVQQDEANLATARAQLLKDRANLEYARAANERAKELLPLDSISRDGFEAAYNLYQQARAQVKLDEAAVAQRQAELDAAKVNLDYTNIVSPVDGTVVSRSVSQGQTVAASFQTPTLFLIANDLTRMQVDSNVSESDIGGIKEGDEASFTVEAFPDRVFHGKVVQIRQAPQTVQNVVTYDVVVDAPNPQLALKPGMTASVRIVIGYRGDALRVPVQALRFRPAGSGAAGAPSVPPGSGTARAQVWLLRNGSPSAVSVTVGLADDSYAEVAGPGIVEGESVIVGERSTAERSTQRANASPGQALPRGPRL